MADSIQQGTDQLLVDVAEYVHNFQISSDSDKVLSNARYCLIDAIGCGMLSLEIPECTKLLGPIVPGTIVPNGVHVPGTPFILDPVQAAFNIGTATQWLLPLNVTFSLFSDSPAVGEGTTETCSPSDNLAAVLSVAEYISRRNIAHKKAPLLMRDVLVGLVKASEIHGILSLHPAFRSTRLDHVALVKVASAAVAAHLLGATLQETVNAISNAFIDGQPLSTYRHPAPPSPTNSPLHDSGTRQSWAAGDAAARAVYLALMAVKGEMGYPTALTARPWGFYGVFFRDNPTESLKLRRPLGSYVIENIIFKAENPADIHQTIPSLEKRFASALSHHFGKKQVAEICKITQDLRTLSSMPVPEFVELFIH